MTSQIHFILQRNGTRNVQIENFAPADKQEDRFAAHAMKKLENIEMTDNDVEIAENNGADFKHDSLMEYSNIQLDFIKVFGKKVFVMVIGKSCIR